jgi:hypothetical protein
MKNENLFVALRTIALNAEHTAPVKLKIGASNRDHQVVHNVLVLIDCPIATIEALQAEGFKVDMCEEYGGLVLDDYAVKSKVQ